MANLYEFRRLDTETSHHMGDAAHPKSKLPIWLGLWSLPVVIAAIYAFGFAADQYVVRAGFSIKSEASAEVSTLMGGLTSLSGRTHTDAAMAADYLTSPNLIHQIGPSTVQEVLSAPKDPLYRPPISGENLQTRWNRMVSARLDSRTGIVSLEVRAFSADGAKQIADAALKQTTKMIASLADQAKKDSLAGARLNLSNATTRAQAARSALTAFQAATGIMSPEAELEIQLALMAQLQAQLTDAEVAKAMLALTTSSTDIRLIEAQNRVETIRGLIANEQQKTGSASQGRADIAAQFSALSLDLEYATQAELQAQASLDAATQAVERNAIFLAVHLHPIKPETAVLPQRWVLVATVALFWSLGLWMAYQIARGLRGG